MHHFKNNVSFGAVGGSLTMEKNRSADKRSHLATHPSSIHPSSIRPLMNPSFIHPLLLNYPWTQTLSTILLTICQSIHHPSINQSVNPSSLSSIYLSIGDLHLIHPHGTVHPHSASALLSVSVYKAHIM